MHFRVGLTGGVASGKTTVSDIFATLGVTVVDADIIARQLLEQDSHCYQQVVQQFGSEVLLNDGEINRPWLRDRIFNDQAAKHTLEKILHPSVRQELLGAADKSEAAYCILVVPLLVEANMVDLVDRTLVVDIPEQLQIQRLKQRDNLTEAQAQAMLNNQATRQQRLVAANDVIDNQTDTKLLQKKVEQLHHFYRELALKYNLSC